MDYLVESLGVSVDKHSRLAEMHAGQCKHYMEQTLCVRQSIMQEPMDFMQRARGVSANKVAQAELEPKANKLEDSAGDTFADRCTFLFVCIDGGVDGAHELAVSHGIAKWLLTMKNVLVRMLFRGSRTMRYLRRIAVW